MRLKKRSGFTLVELLVVIGIIALLISILLPVLNKAKERANTLKCAANLRSVGQALMQYTLDYKGFFPASYIYKGMQIDSDGNQMPDTPVNGYIHWSSYLYGDKNSSLTGRYLSTTGWNAFMCPSLDKGGLPPTNTYDDNHDAGQVNDDGPVLDEQAPRCAYTVNEALCPRNKFVTGFQGALRRYQFVRQASIRNSANTILATEWAPDARLVADAGRANPDIMVCKSHRPVHGFIGTSGAELNMEQITPSNPLRPMATFRRVTVSDLGVVATRIDWVGRNHGTGAYEQRQTNFLYADGHVETKHVRETLMPFQWGDRFYTLSPNDDLAQ